MTETQKRTLVRSWLYTGITAGFAMAMSQLWFGEPIKTLSLNATIIAFSLVFKFCYERRWLRVKWGLNQ